MAGQLRKRGSRAAEPNVQQLDERVLLGLGQFHGDVPFMTCSIIATTWPGAAGLLMNPDAPAACTNSREEVWTSADTTITLATGSISRSFLEHVETVHSLHHQVEEDHIRLVDGESFQRGQPVFGLDHLVTRLLQESPGAAPRQARVVHQQHLGAHILSMMAWAMRSSGIAPSLSPASTTDLGIP